MPDRTKAQRAVVLTLAIGLVVLLALVAVALAQSPSRVVRIGAPGTKVITPNGANPIELTISNPRVCQGGEVLPAGVSAVRVSVWGFFGARMHLVFGKGTHILTEGSRGANWTSDSVTIPIRPVHRTYTGVTACLTVGPNSEPMLLLGTAVPSSQAAVLTEATATKTGSRPTEASRALSGRLGLEYLATAQGDWWSRILTVARHMGLGRAYSGTWIALLAGLLMAAVGALAFGLTLKELR